jgi:hypothetical protein
MTKAVALPVGDLTKVDEIASLIVSSKPLSPGRADRPQALLPARPHL